VPEAAQDAIDVVLKPASLGEVTILFGREMNRASVAAKNPGFLKMA